MENKHQYEFVRIKNKHDKEGGNVWYFRAKTLSELNLHTDRILRPALQSGFDSFSKKFANAINLSSKKHLEKFFNDDYSAAIDMCLGHADNDIEAAIRTIDSIRFDKHRPMSMFETTNQMLFDAYHARVETLRDFGECYLANGVVQFGYNDKNFEICERVFSDEFIYPTQRLATMDDVRIIQWAGGAHYYAKIGNIDVVYDGKQKWDSETEAKKAAYWFIQYEKPYL